MVKKPSRVLVVPSNRPERLAEFCRAWEGRGGWDCAVLVEDAPSRGPTPAGFDVHVSHAEVAADLGEDRWIISRQDSACLCYGFLLAWRMGAQYALTLSDDCYPNPGTTDFFTDHVLAMNGHRRWVTSVPGLRVRGLPYRDLGQMAESAFNVGLWTGVPDLDAQTQLKQPITNFVPPPGNRIVPAGQYVSMCEMNLCVSRKALPLMYFPLMGHGVPYRRFDDIWAGVIAKKVCDHLGWAVSVGEPFIRHERASDPHVNLVKEAPGLILNETFWQRIDKIPLGDTTALTCMGEIGCGLVDDTNGYLSRLGEAVWVWKRLFEASL